MVYEVPSHARFIKKVKTPFPFPKSVQMSNKDVHTTISILGLTKCNITKEYTHTHTEKLGKFGHFLSHTDYCNHSIENILLFLQFKNTNMVLACTFQKQPINRKIVKGKQFLEQEKNSGKIKAQSGSFLLHE